MYISLRDRGDADTRVAGAPRRVRVPAAVVALGVVSLLTDVSSESVSAILPLYLTSVLGMSAVAYGFIDGLYQGVSALVRIASGWASDRSDRPKWIAISGYGLSAVARIALLLTGTVGGVAATVTVDRVGKGIRTAPRDAMISASADPAHLGHAFGVHRTLDTVGAVMGPLIAFGVLWLVPGGYHEVMLISLAFAILGLGVLVLLVPDIRPRFRSVTRAAVLSPVEPRPTFRWRETFTPDLVRLVVLGGALALVTVGDGFIYLALLSRSSFATHWFPLLYVGTNMAYLALALPFGRLADRLGRVRVFVLGHLFLLAAYAAAAVPLSGTAPTVVALVLLGAFYAATDGVLAAAAGGVVDPAVRASGIAVAQTVVAVGRLVASGAFGLLWFLVGPSTALTYVGAALAVLVMCGLLLVGSVRKASS